VSKPFGYGAVDPGRLLHLIAERMTLLPTSIWTPDVSPTGFPAMSDLMAWVAGAVMYSSRSLIGEPESPDAIRLGDAVRSIIEDSLVLSAGIATGLVVPGPHALNGRVVWRTADYDESGDRFRRILGAIEERDALPVAIDRRADARCN
jgi:hypothetical protein